MAAQEIEFGIGDYGNLLIIGNGFDLDLEFKTSYKHFFENNNGLGQSGFPFVRGGNDFHALGRFILDQFSVHSWYGLEDILAQYGSRGVYSYNQGESAKTDRMDYDILVNSLALYLNSLDLSRPKKDSVAARVLEALCNCLIPPTIYSFNYTDVSSIGDALGLATGTVSYVHGNLKDNNIILGVGDYGKLIPPFDYMYKTTNPHYRSTNLFQELDACNNLIIFGLSLSPVDYPYFEAFFKKVASGEYGKDRRKFIRIFTYDEDSRMDILRNLRAMNQGMIALFNNSDFDIIRTKDNMDEAKVSALIEKIENEWQLDV